MNVQFLIAWNSGLWTLEVHKVPGAGRWFNNKREGIAEWKAQQWALYELGKRSLYSSAIAFHVYSMPFVED